MVKQLTLKDHLTADELGRRYRGATDAVARSQWQILWLLARGEATAAAVVATGYSATWTYQLCGATTRAGLPLVDFAIRLVHRQVSMIIGIGSYAISILMAKSEIPQFDAYIHLWIESTLGVRTTGHRLRHQYRDCVRAVESG